MTVGTTLIPFTNGIDIADGSDVVSAALSGTNNDILTATDNHGDTVTFNLSGDYTGAIAQVQSDTLAGGGFEDGARQKYKLEKDGN